MKAATLAAIIVLALAVPVLAAPGDPRLIQGILEWPQTLDRYPVLLIRGDEGTLYYVNIGSAERHGSPRAGARLAVLGVEGKHANEVLAMFVTTSTGPDHIPGGPPAASASTSTTPPAQPPSAPPTPPAGVDAGRTTPGGLVGSSVLLASRTQPGPAPTAAAQAAPAQPGPVQAAPQPVQAAPQPVQAAPQPVQAAPQSLSTAPKPPEPQPKASTQPAAPSSGAPQVAPYQAVPPQPVSPQNAAVAPATAQPASVHSVPVAPASQQTEVAAVPAVAEPSRNAAPLTTASPRWAEVEGIVLAVGYRTLVLKADDGQRVVVDLSTLSPGIASSTLIGTVVKLYGVPIEQHFKAAGFIETVGRPR